METRVDRKLGLRPGRKRLDDPVAPSELIHRFQPDWTILVFRIRPRRFLPINRTQSFRERTRIDMHIVGRMDIAGAAACVHTHASVRVSIHVRESRATRISTREQQETRGKKGRARDLLRFCGASPAPFGRNILCRGN